MANKQTGNSNEAFNALQRALKRQGDKDKFELFDAVAAPAHLFQALLAALQVAFKKLFAKDNGESFSALFAKSMDLPFFDFVSGLITTAWNWVTGLFKSKTSDKV